MISDLTKTLTRSEWRTIVEMKLDWELTRQMHVVLRDDRRDRQSIAPTLKLAFDELFYNAR